MDNECDLSELPWPTPGDKLFAADGDWRHRALLGSGRGKWNIYAMGYKEAADIIVARVLESREPIDLLIYPVVFLYRHYLELRLKEMLLTGRALLNLSDKFEQVHEIDRLWASCRKILEEVWPSGPKADLDAVAACIREFCQVDDRSMSFRYPEKKDGSPSLPTLREVDVRNLGNVMQRLSSLLESSSGCMSDYLSEVHSQESYMNEC